MVPGTIKIVQIPTYLPIEVLSVKIDQAIIFRFPLTLLHHKHGLNNNKIAFVMLSALNGLFTQVQT